MAERWLAVSGYEGLYQVSDQGRIRSLHEGAAQLLRPDFAQGYPRVTLYRDGVKRRYLVHLLVLTAFVGPRPAGMEGLHDNDIFTDARLVNLAWGSRSENQIDAVANGRNRNANKTVCDGHRYRGNTYWTPSRSGNGERRCKTCVDGRRRRAQHSAA